MGQYNSFTFGFYLDDAARSIMEDFHDRLILRKPISAEKLIEEIEAMQSVSSNVSTTLTYEQITEILYFLKCSVLKQEPLTDEEKPFVVKRTFGMNRKCYLAKITHPTRNCISIKDARRFATVREAEYMCVNSDTVENFFEETKSKVALI
jgi:hypothetical protein